MLYQKNKFLPGSCLFIFYLLIDNGNQETYGAENPHKNLSGRGNNACMKLLGHLSKGLESEVLYSVKSRSDSPNSTSIVSVFNHSPKYFLFYIKKSQYILSNLDQIDTKRGENYSQKVPLLLSWMYTTLTQILDQIIKGMISSTYCKSYQILLIP